MRNIFKNKITRLRIKIRKLSNPYLAPLRRSWGGVNKPFTIISNNCWGGLVYQYYNLEYDTPTIGLYFFANDYIKFISNLKYYLSLDLHFINYEMSAHKETIVRKRQTEKPIGILGDIEIVFLHYKSEKEAMEKWNRRKQRIHWDNLFIKFSEMNECTKEHLLIFDNLSFSNKIVLVSKDYGLKSQIIVNSFTRDNEVYDDTTNFREGLSLSKWLTNK